MALRGSALNEAPMQPHETSSRNDRLMKQSGSPGERMKAGAQERTRAARSIRQAHGQQGDNEPYSGQPGDSDPISRQVDA